MKIINKSGTPNEAISEEFYIVLMSGVDTWENGIFYFDRCITHRSEEDAIDNADPEDVVAKVTLVTKIV